MRFTVSVLAGLLILIVLQPTLANVAGHPGNTDSSGCHTCRTNCASWGYAYGEYHCHNGGSGSGGSSGGGDYTTPTRSPSSISLHDASGTPTTGDPTNLIVHVLSGYPVASAWVNYRIEYADGTSERFDGVRLRESGMDGPEYVFSYDTPPLLHKKGIVLHDFIVHDSMGATKTLGPLSVPISDNDAPTCTVSADPPPDSVVYLGAYVNVSVVIADNLAGAKASVPATPNWTAHGVSVTDFRLEPNHIGEKSFTVACIDGASLQATQELRYQIAERLTQDEADAINVGELDFKTGLQVDLAENASNETAVVALLGTTLRSIGYYDGHAADTVPVAVAFLRIEGARLDSHGATLKLKEQHTFGNEVHALTIAVWSESIWSQHRGTLREGGSGIALPAGETLVALQAGLAAAEGASAEEPSGTASTAPVFAALLCLAVVPLFFRRKT